jgi:hypothetical protein
MPYPVNVAERRRRAVRYLNDYDAELQMLPEETGEADWNLWGWDEPGERDPSIHQSLRLARKPSWARTVRQRFKHLTRFKRIEMLQCLDCAAELHDHSCHTRCSPDAHGIPILDRQRS